MSGKRISLGMHTAKGAWPVALFRLWSLASDVIGLIVALLFLKSSDINTGMTQAFFCRDGDGDPGGYRKPLQWRDRLHGYS